MLRSVVLAIAVIAVVADIDDPTDCLYSHTATKANFDLSALQLSPFSSYRVHDAIDSAERNYTYVFNICDQTEPPAPSCMTTQAGTGPAAAFQMRSDLSGCHRLGNNYTNSTWGLIDPLDPTTGIEMTYLNGDWCGSVGHPRTFTIRFRCVDVYANRPSSRVLEADGCHYVLDFDTLFGCPVECPFANRKLCNGHGFCGVDGGIGAPRCFCNSGFGGTDCTLTGDALMTATSSSCNGMCVALVCVVILLAVILVAAFLIYMHVRKLDKRNLRFEALQNSFAADAQARA
jgi:hypothetical protein